MLSYHAIFLTGSASDKTPLRSACIKRFDKQESCESEGEVAVMSENQLMFRVAPCNCPAFHLLSSA